MPNLLEPGHQLIVGATGMGKSRFVLYHILKSMQEGVPLCYIDPKGETILALLAILSHTKKGLELYGKLKDRIRLLDPLSPSDYILGFNAIAPMKPFANAKVDLTALVANSLVSHIRRQSGFDVGEAMRMQNIMAAAVATLLEANEGYTLAELPYLFQQVKFEGGMKAKDVPLINPFVQSILPRIRHYGTRMFWEQQWANWDHQARREWPQSTLGRVFQYLFDERFLYSVCTSRHATLDFEQVVSEGYWLFVNIPFQLLSETVTTVLGNILLSRIFYACLQRGWGKSRYRLIVDEAGFFNTGPLDTILNTSHNFGLDLTMVTQNLSQLTRTSSGGIDYRLLDSVLTDCRSIVTFNSGAERDFETLARLIYPVTGQIVTGIRSSGDFDYLPVSAEQAQNEEKIKTLGYREVIIYDKLSKSRVEVWITPDMDVRFPPQARIAWFEGEHLRATGRPAELIRQEIEEARRRVEGYFQVAKATVGPRKYSRGWYTDDEPQPTQ